MYVPKPPFLDVLFYSNPFNPVGDNLREYTIDAFTTSYKVIVYVDPKTNEYTIVEYYED